MSRGPLPVVLPGREFMACLSAQTPQSLEYHRWAYRLQRTHQIRQARDTMEHSRPSGQGWRGDQLRGAPAVIPTFSSRSDRSGSCGHTHGTSTHNPTPRPRHLRGHCTVHIDMDSRFERMADRFDKIGERLDRVALSLITAVLGMVTAFVVQHSSDRRLPLRLRRGSRYNFQSLTTSWGP
jgi:hypothetical protein